MKNKFNLGIAGNIGVGKTTLTEKLSKDLGFSAIYESVIDNPYLSDFYTNMSRWSFNLQIYFLYTRFEAQVKLFKSNNNFIQDRTIYEDKEIFAANLLELGHMSDRDFKTYCELFNAMLKFIKKHDHIKAKKSLQYFLDMVGMTEEEFDRARAAMLDAVGRPPSQS